MTRRKIATRQSCGEALRELGKAEPRLVVLTADLAGATKTDLFRDAFPGRFINCGIAESNMMGVAAGLAAAGKIPFASTFAMFAAGRAYEQIRNSIGYPHLNVKIAATHGGITVGEDGATHQCLEDLALMRVIPGMVVLNPCDDRETWAAVYAAARWNGPVYLRLSRFPVKDVYENDCPFEIGKGIVLREGTDLTLAACGLCVQSALEAAELLAVCGIDAGVLDLSCIKPLDEELVLEAARQTGCVVTVEEHSVIGGLGSAISQLLARKHPVPVLNLGIQDVYGESGSAEQLLRIHRLDGLGVYAQAADFFFEVKGIRHLVRTLLSADPAALHS